MNVPDDGGPIHPVRHNMHVACVRDEPCRVGDGLTKREYFAASALQGICACPGTYASNAQIAEIAVALADALLAEFAKKPKQMDAPFDFPRPIHPGGEE